MRGGDREFASRSVDWSLGSRDQGASSRGTWILILKTGGKRHGTAFERRRD